MSRKVSTIIKVLVLVLLATFLASQAMAQSPRPVFDNSRENLLNTIHELTLFVPNPEFIAIEEAEIARAFQRTLIQARENLLNTIYESTWFVPNPGFTAVEEAEMARAYQRTLGQTSENLLNTIYDSIWFVPNPDFSVVEEAEMAKAYQFDPDRSDD